MNSALSPMGAPAPSLMACVTTVRPRVAATRTSAATSAGWQAYAAHRRQLLNLVRRHRRPQLSVPGSYNVVLPDACVFLRSRSKLGLR